MIYLLRIKQKLWESSIFQDSFWALAGNVLGKGLALLASIIIARLLGKDLFGMYGLIRTTLLSIAVFSTFGMGYTATKFVADYLRDSPNKVRSIIVEINRITLITSIILATIVFLFSKKLAEFLDTPEIYWAIRFLAIIIVFNAITTTQTGILSGFKKFKALVRINFYNGIVVFFCGVIFTYFYMLEGALFALLVGQIFNCVQNNIEVRKSVMLLPNDRSNSKHQKEILLFSAPVALQEMVYSLSTWILSIALVKVAGTGEMGLYNAANQWSGVVLFIPGTLRNVILSHLSTTNRVTDEQLKIVYQMLVVNFTCTFIPFLIICFSSSLIQEGYGDSFIKLPSVLNISVLSTVFSCMSNVFTQYLMSNNKVWFTFWLRLFRELNTLFLYLFLFTNIASLNSAVGLCLSSLISQVFFLLLLISLFIYTKKQFKCHDAK